MLYIDLFFLTGFYFNGLALGLTAAIGKKPVRIGRICLSAAAGSLFNCFLAVFPLPSAGAEIFVTVVFCGSVMAAAAFPPAKPKELLQTSALLFFSSAVLGGGFLFLKRSLGCGDREGVLLLTAFCAAAMLLFRSARRERARGADRYPVRLYYRGKCREFKALLDSGNRLKEPCSGKPVSVVFGSDLEGFVDTCPGLLCIPFRSVGTGQGMLAGMIFERMEIVTDRGVRIVEKPIVAMAKEPLAANGDFSMLLPESLIFDSAFE